VIDGVRHRYGGKKGSVPALAGIALTIDPGEFVSLVGPSGCGKTTLLRMLAGFLRPTEGRVLVGNQPVVGPGADRGMVFQQPTLFPWLTVRRNVELGPRLRGVTRHERAEISRRLLELVGLLDFGDSPTYELSGGMQQRCAIARALANDPDIVLMDEPFGALDALSRERLQLELRRIWHSTGKTIVFVTHSVEEAVFLGTRVIVLSSRPGRVLLDQPVDLEHADGDVRLTPAFANLRAQVGSAIDRT
jgi:ABC-type nitrate/sulfonate/bicarbonate transport system ATPase subunit